MTTDTTKPNDKAAATAGAMTKEQAAAIVQRQVPKLDKDGKPELDKAGQPVLVGKAIPLGEIIGYKDYGDHVIVVTSRGEKLRGEVKSK